MATAAIDLSPLEGLSIADLIDRFPKVPVKAPPTSAGAVKEGKSDESLQTFLSQENIDREESTDTGIDAVAERNYEEMMKRATKGVISSKEQAALFSHLVTLNAAELTSLHSRVHDAMTLRNPMLKSKGPNLSAMIGLDKGFPVVEVSKLVLDFNGATAPINAEISDKILLGAKSGKFKYTFILPTKDPRYELRVNPISGKLKAGKGPKEETVFSILCKTTVHAKCVVILDIEGGYRHFLTVNVKSEPSLFGVAVPEMELRDDAVFPGFTYKVPALLANLRQYLVDRRGLEEEGIFRRAGDEAETANVKNKLNKGVFKETPDIHAISNLLKVWFRELPVPILNDLPPSVILHSEDEAKCIEEFEKYVKESSKSVTLWLLDFMCETALLEETNKMNARSLAIVIGPNLFHSAESAQLSALESLRLSQQIVNFVMHILNHRLRMHKERLGVKK